MFRDLYVEGKLTNITLVESFLLRSIIDALPPSWRKIMKIFETSTLTKTELPSKISGCENYNHERKHSFKNYKFKKDI
jgi:hypothetical protein